MEELQRKAEMKFGMSAGAGRIPSKELLYGFYHFYWDEEPHRGADPTTLSQDDVKIKFLCAQKRNQILQLANRCYGMDNVTFMKNFHTWNRSVHSEEYPHSEVTPTPPTRKQFVEGKMKELKTEHPHLTEKQLFTRATILWKESKTSTK